MVENLLNTITHSSNNSKTKGKALKELQTLLEKVEVGIEAISREDTEWSYTSQLEEIKVSLENVNIELNNFR